MNTVCIDLRALCRNYQQLQAEVGDSCLLMAVVKADGYGHGMLEVANALQEVGALCFGVGTIHEGKRLRQHGITGRIVVFLGGCGERLEDLALFKLEPVVGSQAQLARLQELVPAGLPLHIKVDCGMGRLGFAPVDVAQVCQGLLATPFEVASVMSHFPVADEDMVKTLQQAQNFAQTVKDVRALGINPMAHMANSAAILGGIASHDMVRAGLGLYGCYPGDCQGFTRIPLSPVMSVKSRVLQVKSVPAGTGVSYGLTQHTQRDSVLAVVGIGYADGYPRMLSSRAEMLIGGQRVPIMGRVCMNMTVVDVTDIAGVECGDEVVVLGGQGDAHISATEIADWADTINYEILCTLGNLNSRVFTI